MVDSFVERKQNLLCGLGCVSINVAVDIISAMVLGGGGLACLQPGTDWQTSYVHQSILSS
jgi:hypothetical protein